MAARLLIDGHVHVHDGFDHGTFLSAAWANFARAGQGLPTLLFTEVAGARVFERWKSGGAPWSVTHTDEPSSLLLDGKLLVVAGRQVVTRENLEVLALCSVARFDDGMRFTETIERVIEAGALCVLPWGVGKWMGRRAALVRTLLESSLAKAVCLGDNGNRLIGTPLPRLLRRGAAQGIPVLAGSDPLPLKCHEGRAGCYGSVIEADLRMETPAASVAAAVRAASGQTERFGRLAGFGEFVRSQVAMQRRKLK